MTELLDSFASRGVVCGPYVRADQPKLATREWGHCAWDGTTFDVYLHSGNAEQTRQMWEGLKGMASGYVLLGGNYSIIVDESAKATVLAAKLGMAIL